MQTEGDRAALAQTEQEVEDAREVVKMVSAEADAARLHITITRYTEIAKALGPEGVRAKLLEDGLRKLNGGLATIAKAAGWPLTEVKDNGSITCGDRPIAMCSESERWRTQSSLQLTLAAITKSKCAVLDRVDLLDDANRLGTNQGGGTRGGQDGHERPALRHRGGWRPVRTLAAGWAAIGRGGENYETGMMPQIGYYSNIPGWVANRCTANEWQD